MASEQRFDAAAHMGTIRTRQGMQRYLAVKHRILWLRSEHPDAEIMVEKVDGGLEAGWVEFKATVRIPSTGAAATDYGSETQQDFPDYYEKAATKATGRALALLGYGTDAAPDLDDGEPMDGRAAAKDERADRRATPEQRAEIAAQHERNVGPAPPSPPRRAAREIAPHPPPPPPPRPDDDRSNVHQHAQLRTLAELGCDVMAGVHRLGLQSIEELSREQAKELIVAGRAAVRNQQQV
jgi:hypothetical protein